MDETLVNIIRLRNMAPERRRAAEKWRGTVATVEWLMSQLSGEPPVSDLFVQYHGVAVGQRQCREMAADRAMPTR